MQVNKKDLFLNLNEVDETSDNDREFNIALKKLQQNPEDEIALNTMLKLADRNHDKARMASAINFLSIGNDREAIMDLRYVDNVDDENFIQIIEMLSSVDAGGNRLQNEKVSKEMAEYVQERLSDIDPDSWFDAFGTSDIAAELFLDGALITDFEIQDLLETYEYFVENPDSED